MSAPESQAKLATSTSTATATEAVGTWRRTFRELALQDFVVFTYLLILVFAVWQGADVPDRIICLQQTVGLLVFFIVALVAIRSGRIGTSGMAGLLYRLAISGSVQLSYFMFRRLLPVANPGSLDEELYQVDMLLFGIEPAIAFDAWVTPFTTEWFSFFYFGYFLLLGSHILPIVLLAKQRQLLGEFTFGLLVVFTVGHTVYMVVPGYGPFHAMPEAFQNPFPPGLWLNWVMHTVESGGAFKDIFPSLHTAAPTFVSLFAFRHRHRLPFRYTWLPVSLFTLNIIVATMFLRWHYLIDVVAGLALGGFALAAAVVATRYELNRRRELCLGESWPEFLPDRHAQRENAGSRTSGFISAA